jgi:hypothetical protein
MAGTTVPERDDAMAESTTRQVRLEHNRLVDDLEALRAAFATAITKLNADGGVTDTNYASVLAATLTAAKVADQDGVTT